MSPPPINFKDCKHDLSPQVDVTILTTGQSSSGRKRRQEVRVKKINFG